MSYTRRLSFGIMLLALVVCVFIPSERSFGLQNPQSGSLGLEATIPSSPPATAATIAVPSNGQSFSSIPITVSGICPSKLLIEVLDNNIFVGSAICNGGSYSLKVDLFSGSNSLHAQDFDALGQGGPLSNTVTVSFTNPNFTQPGSQVVLTSTDSILGANPGQELDWPIKISGGIEPYAVSTDWGDGQSPTLQSSSISGTVTLKHTYSTSGTYIVTVTVTDSKGSTGFLQLVAVASGQVVQSSTSNKNSSPHTTASISTPWWLFVILITSLVPTFWLGSKHGQSVIRRKME